MQQSSLSQNQISLFAGVLVLYPGESQSNHEERIKDLIGLLDSPLSRPGLISRIYLPSQKSYTPLCPLHKPLNALAVHSVFTLISLEVGVRLNSLMVSGRDKVDSETWDRHILNLRSLHGMWLSPDIMRKTFGDSLMLQSHIHCNWDYMTKWAYQPDGCEACMLARMAGDFDTILDLRMAVNSRMYSRLVRRHGEPRLWTWIEAWLRCWQGWLVSSDMVGEMEKRLGPNEVQAQRLKENRKGVTKERRKQRKTRSPKNDSVRRTKRLAHSQLSAYRYMTPEDHIAAEKKKREERYMSSNNTTKTTNKHEAPTNSKEWNGAPPAFGLPPMQSYKAAEDEGEAEAEVEETAHDAENSVIDAYLALISTPFLPGMCSDQHEEAETVLSDSFAHRCREQSAKIDSSASEVTYSGRHQPPRVTSTASSIYSTDQPDHPEYVPPRTGWTKHHKPEYASENRRSHKAEVDAASRVSSWVDCSVPESTLSLNRESKRVNAEELRRKLEQTRPQTIEENDVASRSSSIRRIKTTNTTRRNSTRRNSQRIRNRRSSDAQVVSPISPSRDTRMRDLSPVSPATDPASSRDTWSSTYRYASDPSYQHFPTLPAETRRSPNGLSSRLSRPINDPVQDPSQFQPSRHKTQHHHRRPSNPTKHHHHSSHSNSNTNSNSESTTSSNPSCNSVPTFRDPFSSHSSSSSNHLSTNTSSASSFSSVISPKTKDRNMSTSTSRTTWAAVMHAADVTGVIHDSPAEVKKKTHKEQKRKKNEDKEKEKGMKSFFN